MNLNVLKKIRKGWAFISDPNVLMNKERDTWADTIKWIVMSGLGIPHPFDRDMDFLHPLSLKRINVKPKTKEMLGKDLRSNKDCSSK